MENKIYKIFIVEDEPNIAMLVSQHLQNWGYETVTASKFNDITAEFSQIKPHLVLLDISLPFFNGFYWCSQIRQLSDVPIMFLSANSDNMNIVMAMNMGADDFIPKPFDLNVLTAKVQAILRRTYDLTSAANVLERNGVILNLDEGTLHFEDKKIELTKNEFKILKTLMESRGRTVSREKLMVSLWQSDIYVEENTLTVNINRLRKKLENNGLVNFILTKTGSGYEIE